MIRRVVFFVFCCLQFSSLSSFLQSQTSKDIELLEASVYNKGDTVLIGNGYSIYFHTLRLSKYAKSENEDLDTNLGNEEYKKSAKKIRIQSALANSTIPENILEAIEGYITYNLKLEVDSLIECEGFEVYHFSNNYIWNDTSNSDEDRQYNTLRHNVAYVYRIGEREYKLILFTKEDSLDSTFMNTVATYIKNEGIPQNLFVDSKDSIDFLGEKIPLIESYSYSCRALRQSTKFESSIFSDTNTAINWNYYKRSEDVQEKIDKTIQTIKNSYKDRVLTELADTISFRGNRMIGQRIITQNKRIVEYGYLPPSFTTNYFLNTEIENKNLYLNVSFSSDTNVVELPEFVEDYFFSSLTLPIELTPIQDTIPINDTISIPKKNRFPIWTFHHKNSKINGLSIGVMALASDKNVINNGIRVEAIGSSLFVPFVIILGTAYMPGYLYSRFFLPMSEHLDEAEKYQYAYEVLYHNRLNTTNGLQLSALGSIINTNTVANGLSISGLSNFAYKQNGISVVGLHNYAYKSNGLQIGGLVASSIISNGFLIGLSTQSLRHNGVQIGAYNSARESFRGVQFGGYNRAGSVSGLQVGIFNSAKLLKGIQIGLWNKNQKRSLPFINWGK